MRARPEARADAQDAQNFRVRETMAPCHPPPGPEPTLRLWARTDKGPKPLEHNADIHVVTPACAHRLCAQVVRGSLVASRLRLGCLGRPQEEDRASAPLMFRQQVTHPCLQAVDGWEHMTTPA
jgi:hypothetical protein